MGTAWRMRSCTSTRTSWCGSGGCTVLVFETVTGDDVDELGAFRPAAEISLMHGPVEVSKTTHEGWADLIVEKADGQRVALRFDGETYPQSPADGVAVADSVPGTPAVRERGVAMLVRRNARTLVRLPRTRFDSRSRPGASCSGAARHVLISLLPCRWTPYAAVSRRSRSSPGSVTKRAALAPGVSAAAQGHGWLDARVCAREPARRTGRRRTAASSLPFSRKARAPSTCARTSSRSWARTTASSSSRPRGRTRTTPNSSPTVCRSCSAPTRSAACAKASAGSW